MKKLLLIHALVEMIAGVVFIMNPELILMSSGQELSTIIIAKIYAILMFTFGVICYQLYKVFEFNDAYKKIVLVIMAFHMMVAFQMYGAYAQGVTPNLGAFGLHSILAVLFLLGYMRDPNAFVAPRTNTNSN